ncbi:MAG TPA: UDP-N-acetylmuramoyl-tripeptide--D-alanyl-D-alanine ligase [Anaerolineaceae bacterium]|nr:UDP-N-acetylmuramoyl-tripeptide--D-alanyl-D-alanine ligase [Anaerolineaceae bacterium]
MLNLTHIIRALTSTLAEVKPVQIPDVSIDSREVKHGGLFVAIKGENTDGHNYVEQAFKNGAALALVDHEIETQHPVIDLRQADFVMPESTPYSLRVENTVQALQKVAGYYRCLFDLKVIGITGSVGKSSTKDLTASVLSHRFKTLATSGNQNNEIGLPLTLLRLEKDDEVAVLEMGFYVPGEIKLLCDLAQPQIGVVTNIGTVHAERAGSIETIAKGKAELVQALPPSPNGVAILNYDDERVLCMADQTAARVFYYGLNPKADLWADEIESYGLEGIRCRMHYGDEFNYLTAPLIGAHSVYTMLRAVAVALTLGISWDWIFYGLKNTPVRVRIVTSKSATGAMIIDDSYNASPDSTLAALNLLNELSGRKVAVLGDMLELGQYELEGHQRVGLRASEVADELVLVGPRSITTREAALSNEYPEKKVHWFANTAAASAYLKTSLHEGDVALIKGSHAMHLEEIVGALEEKI